MPPANTKRQKTSASAGMEPVGSNEERSTAELAALAAELAAMKLRVKEAQAQIYEYSLRRLVSSDNGVPFELEGEGDFELEEEGGGDSNIGKKDNYVAGSANECKIVLSRIPVLDCLDDAGPDKIWNRPSMLLHNFITFGYGKKKRRYSSEADIHSIVALALEEATSIVSAVTGVELAVRHGFSIFSNRPDHFVVLENDSGVPVVAIEDKKPGQTGSKAQRECGPAVGQVFD
jgi:hypothetical protein